MANGLCSKCTKPLDGKHRSYCKSCAAEYYRMRRQSMPHVAESVRAASKKWRENNVEQFRHIKRRWRLRAEYGLTMDDFDRMVEQQDNACAICRTEFTDKPYIDHNHITGKVRSLLCKACNFAIGLLADDPDRAIAAAEYLKEHQ